MRYIIQENIGMRFKILVLLMSYNFSFKYITNDTVCIKRLNEMFVIMFRYTLS